MRLTVDTENDALYLKLDESKIVESEEIQPGVILDYDANNMVIGIELLNLSRRVVTDMIKNMHMETR